MVAVIKHFPGLGRVHANPDVSSGVVDRVTGPHDPYLRPFQQAISGLKRGARVTCVVKEVTSSGVEVATTDGVTGFIRKAELSRDRVEQRPDRFAVGEKLDAKVTNIDSANRRVTLSIKALEIEDEKQAMADYGSSDSGASLGDILGPAIKERQEQQEQSQY